MSDIVIEQLGGIVGGGAGPGPLRMEGRVPWSALTPADQTKVSALFTQRRPVNANFRYRLTRDSPNGPETIEVLPENVPQTLIASIKTTIK